MKICPKCGGIADYDSYHHAFVCTRSDCEPRKPTNYERLIYKSPEEMAEWIADNLDCAICRTVHPDKCGYKACKEIWFEWMSEEAEDA